MYDKYCDAALALVEFMRQKPNGIALIGEIIDFLEHAPHNFSPQYTNTLLQDLRSRHFIRIGGATSRNHPRGNMPFQLESMREHETIRIQ